MEGFFVVWRWHGRKTTAPPPGCAGWIKRVGCHGNGGCCVVSVARRTSSTRTPGSPRGTQPTQLGREKRLPWQRQNPDDTTERRHRNATAMTSPWQRNYRNLNDRKTTATLHCHAHCHSNGATDTAIETGFSLRNMGLDPCFVMKLSLP